MPLWRRWLKYAKAKLDSTLRSADDALDRREAALEAEQAGEPWRRDDRAAPDLDDVSDRIGAMDGAGVGTPPPSSEELAFEVAEQQRQAAERLAEIRKSLDADKDT